MMEEQEEREEKEVEGTLELLVNNFFKKSF
jgi:hypothetical protein